MVGTADKMIYNLMTQGDPVAIARLLETIRATERGKPTIGGAPSGFQGNLTALNVKPPNLGGR